MVFAFAQQHEGEDHLLGTNRGGGKQQSEEKEGAVYHRSTAPQTPSTRKSRAA
jgi:hypothetical protein